RDRRAQRAPLLQRGRPRLQHGARALPVEPRRDARRVPASELLRDPAAHRAAGAARLVRALIGEMRVRRGLALAAVVVGLDVLPAAAATSAAAPALLPWAAPAALAVLFVVAMTAHRPRRASIIPPYTPPTTL